MGKSDWMERAEESTPWVIYQYGRTHDGYWPPWSSTHFTGRSRIGLECCVCGHREVVTLRIPRWGPVNPSNSYHPERTRFLNEHAHPDRGHPISWAKPMKNMNVFQPVGGLDLDLLGARLEADLNEDGKDRS